MRGFTVVELLSMIVFLFVIGSIFLVQKNDLEAHDRDSTRKTTINAIYYNLTEVFYPANKYYPLKLTATKLKGLDPASLKDPSGASIGDQASTLRYEPMQCMQDKCKGFSLRANLEREADFVTNSP